MNSEVLVTEDIDSWLSEFKYATIEISDTAFRGRDR